MSWKHHDTTKHIVLEFRRTINNHQGIWNTSTLNSVATTVAGMLFSFVSTCISRNMKIPWLEKSDLELVQSSPQNLPEFQEPWPVGLLAWTQDWTKDNGIYVREGVWKRKRNNVFGLSEK